MNRARPDSLSLLLKISLAFAVLALLWQAYVAHAAFDVPAWAGGGIRGEVLSGGTALGLPLRLVFMGLIFRALLRLDRIRLVGTVALLGCAVSTVLVFADWAALHDIGRQYPAGLAIDAEVRWLRWGVAFHVVFLLCYLVFCRRAGAQVSETAAGSTRPAETLYTAANALGLVCAAMGLLLTAYMHGMELPVAAWHWAVLPLTCVVLLPYAAVLGGWLYSLWVEKRAGLLDEKQRGDIAKAGTTAWLLSVPALAVFFVVNSGDAAGPGSVLWLPVFIFGSLFVFAGSSLCYFRRA